ncbi:hypothetical protein [Streptomyces sp. NPDC088766]|uniref:hypothetical protein n=1 Tax=Streptomyces sp. NPDC088766 TaxID=3365893 RepID=UPI003830F890
MASDPITADAAGTWRPGDTTVSRIGLGTMRLTGDAAFRLGAPGDRDRSIAVLRKAVDLGTTDGSRAARIEHTVAVTDRGPAFRPCPDLAADRMAPPAPVGPARKADRRVPGRAGGAWAEPGEGEEPKGAGPPGPPGPAPAPAAHAARVQVRPGSFGSDWRP